LILSGPKKHKDSGGGDGEGKPSTRTGQSRKYVFVGYSRGQILAPPVTMLKLWRTTCCSRPPACLARQKKAEKQADSELEMVHAYLALSTSASAMAIEYAVSSSRRVTRGTFSSQRSSTPTPASAPTALTLSPLLPPSLVVSVFSRRFPGRRRRGGTTLEELIKTRPPTPHVWQHSSTLLTPVVCGVLFVGKFGVGARGEGEVRAGRRGGSVRDLQLEDLCCWGVRSAVDGRPDY